MTDDLNDVVSDAVWLDKRRDWSVEGLAELCGMTVDELRELVEYGALAPRDPDAPQWTFGGHCVVIVQTAVRLRRDFELDPAGLALALTLINRIHDLEDELRRLQVRIPRHSS